MEDFQELLAEAAKLKTAQIDHKRRDYINAPEFMQRTLTPSDEVRAARLAPFAERLERAREWKNDGNGWFKDQDYESAVDSYTESISVFRYFEDYGEDRLLIDSTKRLSAEQQLEVSEHVTTCMLNVAACYLKTQQPAVVLYCCDQVLRAHPNHVKALYRRGLAHAGLEAANGSVALDAAVADLKQAVALDPTNREAAAALRKYTAMRAAQTKHDAKQFGGMFGRGELYAAGEEAAAAEAVQAERPPMPGAVQRDGMWYDGETGRLLI